MEGKTRVTRVSTRSECMKKGNPPSRVPHAPQVPSFPSRHACPAHEERDGPPAHEKSPAPPNPSPDGLSQPRLSTAWGNSPSDPEQGDGPAPGDASEIEKRVSR